MFKSLESLFVQKNPCWELSKNRCRLFRGSVLAERLMVISSLSILNTYAVV